MELSQLLGTFTRKHDRLDGEDDLRLLLPHTSNDNDQWQGDTIALIERRPGGVPTRSSHSVQHRSASPFDTSWIGQSFLRSKWQYSRRLLKAGIFVLSIFGLASLLHITNLLTSVPHSTSSLTSSTSCGVHDFGCHIDSAQKSQQNLELRQSRSVEEATIEYRRRYERSPPPHFDDWVEYAMKHNASLIDEYDQLEKDLQPFRDSSLSGYELQERMQALLKASEVNGEDIVHRPGVLQIQGGEVKVTGPETGPMSALTVRGIVEPIAHLLPDVTILYNFLATGRVFDNHDPSFVSWEDILQQDFSRKPSYDYLTSMCPQKHVEEGIASRQRDTLDLCQRKDRSGALRRMHGFLARPTTFRPIDKLVPMISRAKMSTMTDIVAANPCYAHKDYRQWGHEDHLPYANKSDTVFWKGASTGIWMQDSNDWMQGHRQRYVAHSLRLNEWIREYHDNTTQATPLPANDPLERALRRLRPTTFDSGFTKLVNCDGDICRQFQKQFSLAARVPPTQGYFSKLVADLDGEGMSCRFYRQLGSNSVPLKQTLWAEWHDGRIMPWLHFIPLSLEMEELPLLVDWLLNDPKGISYALFVAQQGAQWAKRSLRHIDITLHYFRLLIEFADILQID